MFSIAWLKMAAFCAKAYQPIKERFNRICMFFNVLKRVEEVEKKQRETLDTRYKCPFRCDGRLDLDEVHTETVYYTSYDTYTGKKISQIPNGAIAVNIYRCDTCDKRVNEQTLERHKAVQA